MSTLRIAVTLTLVTDYERKVFGGVKQWAKDHGDTELFVWSGRDAGGISPRGKTLLPRLDIRGILAFPTGDDGLRQLQRAGVPSVDVGGTWEESEIPSVHVDNAAVGRMAARHLLDCGLKSFAFWGAPMPLHARQRRDAFAAELKGRGFGCSVFERRIYSVPLPDGELRMVRKWIDALPKPLGIMSWYDHQAIVAAEACRQGGYSVPEQVALVGVDNDDAHLMLSPVPVTSIDVNAFKIGYKAADVLYRMIRTGTRPSQHILMPPGNLIARQSTDMLAIDDPDLVRAMRFIRNNADRHVSVRDLLKAVPISRRNLEIHFKKILGRTPRQQIQHEHIERAKMLCEDFDLSLAETAELSGFPDQATFCHLFKRFEKCTPMQYRRQIMQVRLKG